MSVFTDIAAKTQPIETFVPQLAGVVTPLCLANPMRYALGFAPGLGGSPIISTDPDFANQWGFALANTGITWFDLRSHGAFVQRAWFEKQGVGVGGVIVYELIFPNGR